MAALSNLQKVLGDSKTRTFVLLLGVIVVGGVAVAFMRMGSQDDILADKTSKTLAPPSAIKGTVGNLTPERYTKLLQQENINRVETAEKSNTSAIPTIINSPDAQSLNANANNGLGTDGRNIFGDITRGGFEGQGGLFGSDGSQNSNRPKTEAELREDRLREQRERLERERLDKENQQEIERLRKLMEQQQKDYQDSVSQRAKAMQSHAQAIFTNWGTVTRQTYTAGALSKAYDDSAKRLLDGSGPDNRGRTLVIPSGSARPQGSNRFTDPRAAVKRQVIKAGTVLFGVLDTAVSSDEPSPILATIVGGGGGCNGLRGGRLIGNIEIPKNGEKVILNFKTLSLPKHVTSLKVNVVAIDANTARTALASDVNHHYLLRYGSLFASSFMEGLAQAISQPPGTQTSNSTGQSGGTAVTINQGNAATYPPFTDVEKYGLVPLGKVGEEWGKAVKPYFNRPPTITVDQGTSLGLLFLSDLDLTPEGQQ